MMFKFVSRWVLLACAAAMTGGCANPPGEQPGELEPLAYTAVATEPPLSEAQFNQTATAPQAAPGIAPPPPFSPPTGGPVTPTLPTDPWPRHLQLSNAEVLVYSPQVNAWNGNALDFRSAVAVKSAGTNAQAFGVIWVTARTQVDRVARTVTLENLQITKSNFPSLPGNGTAYLAELQQKATAEVRTISLDRLQSALAVAGVQPPTVAVQNNPPRIIVSNTPAILVPIDGSPVVKAVQGDGRFERVLNTGALIVRKRAGDTWYLHVYDGWMSSASLTGPWTTAGFVPFGLNDLAQKLAKSGKADLLNGGPNANPKPLLANGAPVIYTSEIPAELLVFRGQPDFTPVAGTQLLWANNTTADVLVDIANNYTYVLVSGRWFRAASLAGPWSYVPANALSPDFAKIPKESPAGAVLATVAGTPQAQEAVIENSIPQTATVPRANGPTFVPTFDGAPQYQPIAGTPLSYVTNTPYPVIRVDANTWYAATQLTGPWVIATSVPAVIYTIPPSSRLHYVTYVRIYGYTPQVVYSGYTPGYLGTIVTPDGTVVYGTGYTYDPWIGTVWYPPPYTYGMAAAPLYNPAVGYTYGFALGLATAAWVTPYWGGAYYHPGYWGAPCCGSASANVYRNWGTGVSSGTRTWYSNTSNIGTAGSGTYSTDRGVSGSYSGYRNYNYASGTASEGYSRSGSGQYGGSGNVSRSQSYNAYTGQRNYNANSSVTAPGGSSVQRSVSASTAPGQAPSVSRSTTVDNARTGQTNTYSSGRSGDDAYATRDGNTVSNNGSGWQHTSGSGSVSSSDAAAADREQQARSTGASRAQTFGGGGFGGDRFGGSGFGGDRFSGGFGDRFGGGGFGGGRFGGGGFRR
jgi:hypothetical protein